MFLRPETRILAAFLLPFAAAACDELTSDGRVVNSPNDALAGCENTLGSCNPEGVSSGLVAKLEGDPDTGELFIRFVTLTKNDDGSFTYDDGDADVDLEDLGGGIFSSASSKLTLDEVLSLVAPGTVLSKLDEDESFIGSDELFGYLGYHTDASVITDSNVIATYSGTAEFDLLVSGLSAAGSSDLEVNFADGSADLIAIVGAGTITDFDKLVSSNMTVDGYSFTGTQIELFDGGIEVDLDDVVGSGTHDAAAGMFFGDVDENGHPAEYGAIAVVTGNDDKLLLLADGVLDE